MQEGKEEKCRGEGWAEGKTEGRKDSAWKKEGREGHRRSQFLQPLPLQERQELDVE